MVQVMDKKADTTSAKSPPKSPALEEEDVDVEARDSWDADDLPQSSFGNRMDMFLPEQWIESINERRFFYRKN